MPVWLAQEIQELLRTRGLTIARLRTSGPVAGASRAGPSLGLLGDDDKPLQDEPRFLGGGIPRVEFERLSPPPHDASNDALALPVIAEGMFGG